MNLFLFAEEGRGVLLSFLKVRKTERHREREGGTRRGRKDRIKRREGKEGGRKGVRGKRHVDKERDRHRQIDIKTD